MRPVLQHVDKAVELPQRKERRILQRLADAACRRLVALGAAYFGLFLLPVILATLTFPFAWMDHLTAISLYLQRGCCSFSDVLPNFYFNCFHTSYVRPTAAALYSLQYSLFGGEFWLWFVVRWIVAFAAVGACVRVLEQLGAARGAKWLAAALLLFHPAALPLYLFTADILVALGCYAILALLLAGARERARLFDLDGLSPGWYGATLLAWLLTLGVKEVAVVFCALVALAFTLSSRISLRNAARLLPFYAALLFDAWRLFVNASDAAGVGRLTVTIFLSNLGHHLRYLEVPSPFHILGIGAVLLFGLAIVRVCASTNLAVRHVSWLALAAAAGMLLMTSTIARPDSGFSTRYVVPSLFLLTLPLGLAWSTLPRWSGAAAAAVVIALPFLEASDLYSQTLAYQQRFYNQSDTLALLEAKRDQGYRLAVAVDSTFQGEYGASVAAFFQKYSQQFYGQAGATRVYHFPADMPIAPPFVVLTAVGPESFAREFGASVDMAGLTAIETVPLGNHGFLDQVLTKFLTLDKRIGNTHFPYYDPIGAPQLRAAGSDYFVYTFGGVRSSALGGDAQPQRIDHPSIEISGDGAPRTMSLANPQRLEVRASADHEFLIKVDLGSPPPGTEVEFLGKYDTRGDRVFFGVAASDGAGLWNVLLPPTDTLRAIPLVPALQFVPGRKYALFFWGARGKTQFAMDNVECIRFHTVRLVRPARRYGAVTR